MSRLTNEVKDISIENLQLNQKGEQEMNLHPEAGVATSVVEGKLRDPEIEIAALEYQVASLLDDKDSTLHWRGKVPIAINKRGDWARKLSALQRIAKYIFPKRGDVDEVLDHTIADYGLWTWSNPLGFWKAFKRDMFDAKKGAYEAKREPLELSDAVPSDGTRIKQNSYEWTASGATQTLDTQIARQWHLEAQRDRWPSIPFKSLEAAKASGHAGDITVVRILDRLLKDKDYLEVLSLKKVANLARVVKELQRERNCSIAEAYRLLKAFKKRSSVRKPAGVKDFGENPTT